MTHERPTPIEEPQVRMSVIEFKRVLHDLRGPLAAIVMNGEELAASEDVGGPDAEALADILGSARDLLALLDRLRARHLEGGPLWTS